MTHKSIRDFSVRTTGKLAEEADYLANALVNSGQGNAADLAAIVCELARRLDKLERDPGERKT